MLKGDNNLKDTSSEQGLTIKDTFLSISYPKTNKLISALYMVTDVMDKDEPIRHKLRILASEIVSDIHGAPTEAGNKIYEIVSFLDISSTVHLISDMNRNILKKEFLELHKAIKEYEHNKQASMEDFLRQPVANKTTFEELSFNDFSGQSSIGHQSHAGKQLGTRIGVQKGSTLMKALSDKTNALSPDRANRNPSFDFNLLKKERRHDIVNIIKDKKEGATIKDIKNIIKDKNLESLASSGEKTLQRELVSMVKDGVLNKTGEKRWSRYFLAK